MRKICIFTSTRADYGLLRGLARKIHAHSNFKLQLLVSGTHLLAAQGMTVNEIIADEFECLTCVDIELTENTPEGICHSIGLAVSRYGTYLAQTQPDILIILGDRFEALACAMAAHVCHLPIAHIHGGETTEGAIDEAFRHSITKMAQIHFPCCEEYRQRIIQLGEQPNRVFNVGALSVENMLNIDLLEKEKLESSINFLLDKPFFLITFHPTTLDDESSGQQFSHILSALKYFPDHKAIFTQANSDTDSKIINQMLQDFTQRHPEKYMSTPSLGYINYLSAMKICAAVIGNSSSGIMEAPFFKVPTINIGDRQKGRLRQDSIIDCSADEFLIKASIEKGLTPNFRNSIKDMVNPYGLKNTSDLIINTLYETNWTILLKKSFFNLVH